MPHSGKVAGGGVLSPSSSQRPLNLGKNLAVTSGYVGEARPELVEGDDDARLEEEAADMRLTLDILRLTSARMDEEEAIKLEEEEDMGRTLELLAQALSETESQLLRGERTHNNGKFVHFSPHVKVSYLPLEERVEAKQARKKVWAAGPLHDELWDGDVGEFREEELSLEELALLLKRKTTVATKLRSLFASRVVNIDARAHARRLQNEEEDEPTVTSPQNEQQEGEDSPVVPKMEKRRSTTRLLSFASWVRRASSGGSKMMGSRRSSKESMEDSSSRRSSKESMDVGGDNDRFLFSSIERIEEEGGISQQLEEEEETVTAFDSNDRIESFT